MNASRVLSGPAGSPPSRDPWSYSRETIVLVCGTVPFHGRVYSGGLSLPPSSPPPFSQGLSPRLNMFPDSRPPGD